MPAQQAVGKAVKCANPKIAGRHIQQALDAMPHLGCRFVGKGNRKQALWTEALDIDQPGGAMGQHAGLTATSAGDHQQRLRRRANSFALSVIQRIEYRGYVHRAWRFENEAV